MNTTLVRQSVFEQLARGGMARVEFKNGEFLDGLVTGIEFPLTKNESVMCLIGENVRRLSIESIQKIWSLETKE
jgi:hypothetical protein